jgi:hypothetical protein
VILAYDRGRWGRPPWPFRVDADRWQGFLRTLDKRLKAIRRQEGIDSGKQPWQTFDPPLPPAADIDPPPPVLLRLQPIPSLERSADGRLRARRDTEEESAS